MMTVDAAISPLTPKQSRFVEEYLLDMNATQAAIRAGYSQRTAKEQGAQLLTKPAVMAAVDAAKIDRSTKLKVDAEWMLQRLVDEAEADLVDLYDDKGDIKPVDQWPEIWRKGLVSGVEVEALFDGVGKDRRQIGYTKKLRLSDRVRRLELIGKHIKVNAFQEQVKVDSLDGLADRLDRIKDIELSENEAMAQEVLDLRRRLNVALTTNSTKSVLASDVAPATTPNDVQHPTAECTAPAAPRPEPRAPVAPPPSKPYRPIMPDPEPVSWPTTIGHAATDYDPNDI